MAVDTYALTTLAKLQGYLGITGSTDEVVLEGCIDRASARIETFIDRKILTRSYVDWVFPERNVVRLRNWPATAVRRVAYGSTIALTVNATTTTDVRATVAVTESSIVLKRWDSDGTATTSTLAFTTYPTTNGMATAISALTGWSATASDNLLSAELYPVSGADALSNAVYLDVPDIVDSPAWVDMDTGLIRVSVDAMVDAVGGNRPVLVDYDAGYSTVPYDVEQACLEVAATMYRQRRYDTGTTLGDFRVVDDPADTQRMLEGLLSGWREVR